jgi:hypothetical protein
MKTVAAIFNSRADAERALEALRGMGLEEKGLNLLTPGTTAAEADAEVPTTETEQPGMGKAVGTWAGGALGVAGGLHIGTVIASFIPGVGPVLAAGMIGAALLGAGGAAAGSAVGGALEDNIAPELPHDELYVYEDALRKGRTVVIAAADDEEQAGRARAALEAAGAESIDAARESWWVGLRDAEESEYAPHGDFKSDEADYRRGFESALDRRARGLDFESDSERLRERHADAYARPAFRRGYERGQAYLRGLGGGDAG